MKTKLLLLLIFLPAFVFSQTKIRGKVVDKETQKSVSDVIVHSTIGVSITNDKGEFEVEINQSGVIYFRHLSYKSFNIQAKSLQDNGVVYLIPNVTELDEIVISPNRAASILDKAVGNLYANFQPHKTKTYYLTHTEGSTTTGGKKEVYALIESIIDSKKKNPKAIRWNFKLAQLDRLYNSHESDFNMNGKMNLSILFFPRNIAFLSRSSNARYEIYDDNDNQLTIKMSPISLDKEQTFNYFYCLWTINKADTVLTEFLGQTFANADELTKKDVNGVSYCTSNNFDKMEFMKDSSGVYYLSKLQRLIIRKVLADNPYEVHFKVLTYPVNVAPKEIKKRKKINIPYEGALFQSKLPNSPGFWKKYVNH